MRHTFSLYILVMLFIFPFHELSAQTRPLVYQFSVRNAGGDLVKQEEVDIELELLAGGPEGRVVYRETQFATTSENGLVRLRLGQGFSEQDFSNVTWNVNQSYFIRATIEDLLNTGYTFQHTSELLMITPRIFSGGVQELSDPFMDTARVGIKALSVKDNKVYLTNGGVIELPRFMKNVNSLLIQVEKRDVSCHGMKDGAVDISVQGGHPPYSYEWSNGKKTQDLDNLKAGDYKVYVTDNKGYTAIKQVTITQPDPLEINPQIRNVSRVGAEDGSIQLRTSGGRPPYSYQWSTGEESNSLSGLAPGYYTVKVSSRGACSVTKRLVVKEPVKLSFDREHVKCYGEKNGSVRMDIHGGKPPYTIRWSNNQSGRELNNLPSGRYYVSVEDSWGYQVIDSVSVLQPYPLKVNASVENIQGDTATGKIQLDVKGGIPPYSYQWSTRDTTRNLAGVRNGVYSVTVKDKNGCRTRENNIFVYRIMKDPRDTQRYQVITIGEQTWMAENMNIGQQVPPDEIPEDDRIIEKSCYNNSQENCNSLGGLYTWGEATQYSRPANRKNSTVQGICPDGWHLPSEKEWRKLSEYLGGEMVAGNRLKNLNYWNDSSRRQNRNRAYLDVTGFAALPAGRIDLTGDSYYMGISTSFWSASKPNSDKAWHRTITTRGSGLYRDASYTSQKFSVRCIKDKKH